MTKLLILCLLSVGSVFQLKADNDLKRYVGRYEVEPVAVIPISTLDVTLANGTLWLKPSLLKKRKLIAKSAVDFVDEIDQAKYKFNLNQKGEVQSLAFQYEGESYTALKLVLPPPSVKGNTTFELKGHPEANLVALAGSFNDWNQSQLIFAREGDRWICRIDLAPGVYTYKFIVDGNWITDPANPRTKEDEAGNVNSLLDVAEKVAKGSVSPTDSVELRLSDLLKLPGEVIGEGTNKTNSYRVEEVALPERVVGKVRGEVVPVSKAFRIILTGPVRVRALPPVIWIDEAAVGYGVENEDLNEITAVTYDQSLLREGATLYLSYGKKDDKSNRVARPEKLKLSKAKLNNQ